MLRVVTSRPTMRVTPSGKAPRTQSAASGSCHTFASHAGLTLPMTKKAPPRYTRLLTLAARPGSRCRARATLVRLARARMVTSPGCSFTQSTMNWAALLPHGEPLGRLSPVLPRPGVERGQRVCEPTGGGTDATVATHRRSRARSPRTARWRRHAGGPPRPAETARDTAATRSVPADAQAPDRDATHLGHRHIWPARHLTEVQRVGGGHARAAVPENGGQAQHLHLRRAGRGHARESCQHIAPHAATLSRVARVLWGPGREEHKHASAG